MESGSCGECGDVEVDGWNDPAYVSYIGGVFEVAVQILAGDWFEDWGFHCFRCFGTKVVPGNCRKLVFVLIREGLLEFLCVGIFFFSVSDRTQFFQIRIHMVCKDFTGD